MKIFASFVMRLFGRNVTELPDDDDLLPDYYK